MTITIDGRQTALQDFTLSLEDLQGVTVQTTPRPDVLVPGNAGLAGLGQTETVTIRVEDDEDEIETTESEPAIPEEVRPSELIVPVDVYDVKRPDMPPRKRFLVETKGPGKKTAEQVQAIVEEKIIDGSHWKVDSLWIRYKAGDSYIVVYATRIGA